MDNAMLRKLLIGLLVLVCCFVVLLLIVVVVMEEEQHRVHVHDEPSHSHHPHRSQPPLVVTCLNSGS